jgi:hypothetical protein
MGKSSDFLGILLVTQPTSYSRTRVFGRAGPPDLMLVTDTATHSNSVSGAYYLGPSLAEKVAQH